MAVSNHAQRDWSREVCVVCFCAIYSTWNHVAPWVTSEGSAIPWGNMDKRLVSIVTMRCPNFADTISCLFTPRASLPRFYNFGFRRKQHLQKFRKRDSCPSCPQGNALPSFHDYGAKSVHREGNLNPGLQKTSIYVKTYYYHENSCQSLESTKHYWNTPISLILMNTRYQGLQAPTNIHKHTLFLKKELTLIVLPVSSGGDRVGPGYLLLQPQTSWPGCSGGRGDDAAVRCVRPPPYLLPVDAAGQTCGQHHAPLPGGQQPADTARAAWRGCRPLSVHRHQRHHWIFLAELRSLLEHRM